MDVLGKFWKGEGLAARQAGLMLPSSNADMLSLVLERQADVILRQRRQRRTGMHNIIEIS